MMKNTWCFEEQSEAALALHALPHPFYALLSGPPRSGKTSLLLQFAYHCALQEDSSTVVFLCKRHNLERKPPYISQDADAAAEAFERVHMKYVDDDEGIRKYFAAFHLHDSLPRAVIIDDFCEFFNEWKCKNLYGQLRGRDIAIIRTLALCRDAIDYANNKMPANSCCKLLIADAQTGQGPRLLYIFKRWLSTIWTIEALGSRFTLKPYCDGETCHNDIPQSHHHAAQKIGTVIENDCSI